MAESLPGSVTQASQTRGGQFDTAHGGGGTVPLAVDPAHLVRAAQVATDAEVRQSPNGVRFATFGETGLADLDLDRMLEAVPQTIVAALNSNTYFFVPLALREKTEPLEATASPTTATETTASGSNATPEPVMVASAYTDEFSDAAICHRNVELDHGRRGVFISTRLLSDRFALSFEFFINVAHAFVDQAGVPEAFNELAWKQAQDGVRGETSLDAWECRNLAFGRAANAEPEPLHARPRRPLSFAQSSRSFSGTLGTSGISGTLAAVTAGAATATDEKQRTEYVAAAFTDAVAMYLLSLTLDFDYSELRERDYPLLQPQALAARLKLVAELFPPNAGYEFALKYRRRA